MRAVVLRLLALLPIPVIVALVIWAGDRPVPPPVTLEGGSHAKNKKVALSIPGTLASGWKLNGKVEQYDKKSLFDRINGAAPAYIRAGFMLSLGAEFRREGMTESVVADVYDMGSPARALGMYATERDPSYRFIVVGKEGYLASGSLNFWQSQFYVKLAGYEEGEAMDKALEELARALGAILPRNKTGEKELAPLELLPPSERVPNSAGYSHPPLGEVEGLSEVFFVSYRASSGEAYRLFVGRFEPADAARRFEKAKAYFKKENSKMSEGEVEGGRTLLVEGDTTHLLLQAGQLVAGGIDLPDAKLVPIARTKLREVLAGSKTVKPVKKAEAR